MNSGSVPKIFILGNKILSNKLLQLQKECTIDHSHQNMLDESNKQKTTKKTPQKTSNNNQSATYCSHDYPFALRKAKIAYNFGLFECNRVNLPYLPYIFGRIKIIIFFTVRTFNLEKNYNFFSVRIFTNAEKLPIVEGIHRYICGNFSVYTDRCENKQFSLTLCCFIN